MNYSTDIAMNNTKMTYALKLLSKNLLPDTTHAYNIMMPMTLTKSIDTDFSQLKNPCHIPPTLLLITDAQ
jgi:hypothetical protein